MKNPVKVILWNLFSFCLSFHCLSQDLSFRRIGVNEGLSLGDVQCVLKDSKGFMWLGTQDGLNKFNGYEITIYRHQPNDKNSIYANDIYTLYEDKSGIIWIGSHGDGLNSFNPRTNKFSALLHNKKNKKSISNNSIRSILEDKQNNFWVGTDNGLNLLNRATNEFQHFSFTDDETSNSIKHSITSIVEDNTGNLWIGTLGKGLQLFDVKSKQFKKFIVPPSLKYFKGQIGEENLYLNDIKSLCLNENILLIGTEGGLMSFDVNTKKFIKLFALSSPDQLAKNEMNRIWSIAKFKNNLFYLGSYNTGLILFDLNTESFKVWRNDESNPESLSSNDITQVIIDDKENIWIATQSGGINVFLPAAHKFKLINKVSIREKDVFCKKVHAVIEDKENNIWIGTAGGGITLMDSKTGNLKPFNEILEKTKTNAILALLEDKDGDVWIGTWGQGVILYHPKSKTTEDFLGYEDGGGTVIDIEEGPDGTIWVATFGDGIFAIDKKTRKVKKHSSANGLPGNNFYCVKFDSHKTMWIGTEGNGLIKIKQPSFDELKGITNITVDQGISANNINSIFEDKEGNIWLATSLGLDKLEIKTNKITTYFEKDGLPNNYIYSIVPDEQGNFWMTTNKGIVKFNPNMKNIDGSAFHSYDLNEGIQGLEFNQGAFYKNKTGDIFFGGENGLNIFNPSVIKNQKITMPMNIVSFKKSGDEVKLDTSITYKRSVFLSFRDTFSFEYVGIDYASSSKIKYSYILEGSDGGWSFPTTNRHKYYMRLSGGDYVFKVKATNSDGEWCEPASINVHVDPPWWKTNWFYSVCVILIVASIFGFVKMHTASIKKENRILEQKVAERTHELEQKNRDITSSIEYAKRIQLAILPPQDEIYAGLEDLFILYKPKDIVSGDFYFYAGKSNLKIIAAVDCTGHGVPGAFMSMIGHNLLHQIISERGIVEPGKILENLHFGVQNALKQGQNEIRTSDGMDAALCAVNKDTNTISYAGANRNLIIVNKVGKLEKIDSDKFPIGGAQLDMERKFKTTHITLAKGDCFYLFSDGYADQFGGEKGKKFMVKQLHDLLTKIHLEPMNEQHKILDGKFEQWKGNVEQVDDILIIGIRI